jgi:hypothetical protein
MVRITGASFLPLFRPWQPEAPPSHLGLVAAPAPSLSLAAVALGPRLGPVPVGLTAPAVLAGGRVPANKQSLGQHHVNPQESDRRTYAYRPGLDERPSPPLRFCEPVSTSSSFRSCHAQTGDATQSPSHASSKHLSASIIELLLAISLWRIEPRHIPLVLLFES